jgi:hypothetical protein
VTTSGDHRCANNGQSGNLYIALEPGMEIIDPPNPLDPQMAETDCLIDAIASTLRCMPWSDNSATSDHVEHGATNEPHPRLFSPAFWPAFSRAIDGTYRKNVAPLTAQAWVLRSRPNISSVHLAKCSFARSPQFSSSTVFSRQTYTLSWLRCTKSYLLALKYVPLNVSGGHCSSGVA